MKKTFIFFVAIIMSFGIFAQSPEKMSYQAVIRNAGNLLVSNQTVGVRVSIIHGSIYGASVFVETHSVTTNINGLASFEIGAGTLEYGNFSTIDWASGPYFIKTETDPLGGVVYSITGISQIMSVPYALHAKTAETVTGGITENDPVFMAWDKDYYDLINTPVIPTVPTNVSAFTNDAGYITSFTESQILSISNDTIFLTGGSFVKLPAGFSGDYNDLTNQPTIPTVPTNVSAFTNDAGYLTQEVQVLSISNDTLFLTGGSFVKLPAGFDGDWSSLIGTAPNVSTFPNDAGYLTSFTESQILTISNDTIFLTGGSFVKLPAGFDGDWSSLIGTAPNVSTFPNDAGYLTTESQTLHLNGDTLSIAGGNSVVLPASGVSGGGFEVFTASGTFTVPEGVTQIIVEVWGAGGGGNYSTGQSCSGVGLGGGGGGYGKAFISVTPNSSYTVIIGTGGAGGTNPSVGSNGGSSSFATFVTASGGGGANVSSVGAGGTSTAFISYNGEAGSGAGCWGSGPGGKAGGGGYEIGKGGNGGAGGYTGPGAAGKNGYCIVYW